MKTDFSVTQVTVHKFLKLKFRECDLRWQKQLRHGDIVTNRKHLLDSFCLIIKTISNLSATFGQFLSALIKKKKVVRTDENVALMIKRIYSTEWALIRL